MQTEIPKAEFNRLQFSRSVSTSELVRRLYSPPENTHASLITTLTIM